MKYFSNIVNFSIARILRGGIAAATGLVLLWPAFVNAAFYELADSSQSVIGEPAMLEATFEDTFVDVGRRNNMGFEELRIANRGIDPWVPGAGTEILIPSMFVLPPGAREGIVVNLAEYRIYYYYQQGAQQYVATMPASVGRMDWATPLGLTRITAKAANPNWYPPESVRKEHEDDGRPLPRIVPAGPDNPLGKHALRLGLPGYLIHGTNRPDGVGMRVTHGCIRLFPEDIEWLFGKAPTNTKVLLINEPLKFGWLGDDLFLEAHPVLAAAPERTADEPVQDEFEADVMVPASMTEAVTALIKVTAEGEAEVDWDLVSEVIKLHSGVPVKVGHRRPVVEDEVDEGGVTAANSTE